MQNHELGWDFCEFLVNSIKPSNTLKTFQRLQASELLSILLRTSALNQELASKNMTKMIEPLTNAIIESIGAAEIIKNQKVKKTIQIVGLWTKAAKLVENTEVRDVQGTRVIKAIEAVCEKDKAFGNLKSKVKEIKKTI